MISDRYRPIIPLRSNAPFVSGRHFREMRRRLWFSDALPTSFAALDKNSGITGIASLPYTLRPFEPSFASHVASWVRDARELFWLAPGTPYPLTPAKVTGWTRNRGMALLLFGADESLPCGYGELNPVRRDPHHVWLGHLVIDRARRREGLGQELTWSLIDWAFQRGSADRLTLVVFPNNVPAISCYLDCGFRLLGEEFQRFQGLAEPQKLLRFEMLAADAAEAALSQQRNTRARIG